MPDDAYSVAENAFEPVGTKFKFWFSDGLRRYLFKQITRGTGEDWSEKVACELCRLLGLPHAEYELADWRRNRGVVSRSFLPPSARLIFGNELLLKLYEDYPAGGKFFRVTQHTLGRVLAIMRGARGLQVPIRWEPFGSVSTPLDVFIGFLMLDAWIGNQDRHHQNWGLIWSPVSGAHLAPTFDHASSMGRNETDQTRARRLGEKDPRRGMVGYVEKARSAFYQSTSAAKAMPTVDAFVAAAALRPGAARAWLDRLRGVSREQVRAIFSEVPPDRISPLAVDFAVEMLEINRLRLIDG